MLAAFNTVASLIVFQGPHGAEQTEAHSDRDQTEQTLHRWRDILTELGFEIRHADRPVYDFTRVERVSLPRTKLRAMPCIFYVKTAFNVRHTCFLRYFTCFLAPLKWKSSPVRPPQKTSFLWRNLRLKMSAICLKSDGNRRLLKATLSYGSKPAPRNSRKHPPRPYTARRRRWAGHIRAEMQC